MSGNASNGAMLKAAGLWSKTSAKGGQYLTGRLGGVKVLVMENRDRHSDDAPSHILYFVEVQERRQERGDGVRAPGAPDASDAIRGAAQRLPEAGAAGCRPSGAARPR